MTTASCSTVGEATLALVTNKPESRSRLIVTFEEVTSTGEIAGAKWRKDGDHTYHLHTFTTPPTEAEVQAKLDDVVKAHTCLPYLKLRYLSHELCTGEELCNFERLQIEQARKMPECFKDSDMLPAVWGPIVEEMDVDRWVPKTFIQGLVEAREIGLAELVTEAA